MGRIELTTPIIVIGGPTASGKTDLSLILSELMDIEIISADSRQIYKYLDIGTAKPTPTELAKIKHHFVDILSPEQYFSAGVFGNEAYTTAIDIYSRGKIPVVVGGSGLYIQALLEGFFEEENFDFSQKEKIKTELIAKLQNNGKDELYNELVTLDNVAAEKYPDKNPHRIIRALTYIYLTNKKFSSTFNNNNQRNIKYLYFALNPNREILYDRINRRTEKMWKNGIVDETKKVLEQGYDKSLNSLNTVGYKECIDFIEGNINQERAIELIKQNTRRYAKRQMTWLRRVEDIIWIDTQISLLENAKVIFGKTQILLNEINE